MDLLLPAIRSSHSTFTFGQKEWAVVYRDSKLSSCTARYVGEGSGRPARFRLGGKSGRLFLVKATSLRAHSTLTFGKKEWAVFIETSMEKARTQHFYVWEEEWTVFIEMSLMELARAQHVTSGKKNGRYLSRCRCWDKACTQHVTSGKKSGWLFHEMTSIAIGGKFRQRSDLRAARRSHHHSVT